MGQQWERSLFCQFQLLGSYWEVHWLKLTPGLNRVLGGKTTPPNIFFRPILPNFEEIFEIVVGDFERWPMLPVRKTNTKFYRTFLSGSNHIAQSRRQANSGHVQGNNTEAAPLMTRLSDKVTEDGIGCSCNQRKDREDKNNSSLCTSCAWTPICCTPKQK